MNESKWNSMSTEERLQWLINGKHFIEEIQQDFASKQWSSLPRFAKDHIIISTIDLSK
jgi:hypothetical protein